jgi:hypothetical protein
MRLNQIEGSFCCITCPAALERVSLPLSSLIEFEPHHLSQSADSKGRAFGRLRRGPGRESKPSPAVFAYFIGL